MKIENNKIIEITASELFSLYLKRGMDDIMSFPDYRDNFERVGCTIKEGVDNDG